MKVTAADGEIWEVRRRWMPRWDGRGLRARWRKRSKGGDQMSDAADPTSWVAEALDNPLAIIGVVIAGVLLIFGLVFFIVPLLLALFDLLLILLVAVLSVIGRICFGRPWRVDATSPDGTVHIFEVRGLRTSSAAKRSLADSLRVTGTATLDGAQAQRIVTPS